MHPEYHRLVRGLCAGERAQAVMVNKRLNSGRYVLMAFLGFVHNDYPPLVRGYGRHYSGGYPTLSPAGMSLRPQIIDITYNLRLIFAANAYPNDSKRGSPNCTRVYNRPAGHNLLNSRPLVQCHTDYASIGHDRDNLGRKGQHWARNPNRQRKVMYSRGHFPVRESETRSDDFYTHPADRNRLFRCKKHRIMQR